MKYTPSSENGESVYSLTFRELQELIVHAQTVQVKSQMRAAMRMANKHGGDADEYLQFTSDIQQGNASAKLMADCHKAMNNYYSELEKACKCEPIFYQDEDGDWPNGHAEKLPHDR